MKSIFNFIENLIEQKILVLILGILLVVFSATKGIRTSNIDLSLDIAGRIVVGILGLILIFFYWRGRIIIHAKNSKFKIPPLFSDKPFEIIYKKRNCRKINSEFILWDKCTIMFWIYIPPKNEGIRNSPSNRYILSHYTGVVNPKDSYTTFYNQFCLRHNTKNKWSIAVSNNQAEYIKPITLDDELLVGWHHFFVAWNTLENELKFLIRDRNGEVRIEDVFDNCFDHWVEKLHNKVTVGAWQKPSECHYCEAKLYNFLIICEYLNERSRNFKRHLENKPLQ
jgi:hypothetical protein